MVSKHECWITKKVAKLSRCLRRTIYEEFQAGDSIPHLAHKYHSPVLVIEEVIRRIMNRKRRRK
jgi:Mor family transcriptional regulator